MSKKYLYKTLESSNKKEFDKNVSIMINQGWKIVGNNFIEGKYSQSLSYSYKKNERVELYENGFIKYQKKENKSGKKYVIREYYENGSIRNIENYKYFKNDDRRDDRHGDWTQFYENGKKRINTSFSNDSMVNYLEINSENGERILFGSNLNLKKQFGDGIKDYGEITFNLNGTSFSGDLYFSKIFTDGSGLDSELLNKLFSQLIKREKSSKSTNLMIFDDSEIWSTQNEYNVSNNIIYPYWEENRFFENNLQKFILPLVYITLDKTYSGFEINIISFGDSEIHSKSKIFLEFESGRLRVIPKVIEFFQSGSLLIKYYNHEDDKKENYSFLLNKDFYEKDYNDVMNVSGELTFYSKGKRVLRINNMLLVNPRNYGEYLKENYLIQWYLYNENTLYQRGNLELKRLYDDVDLIEKKRKDDIWKGIIGDRSNKPILSSKSKYTLFKKNGDILFERELNRETSGKVYGDGLNDDSNMNNLIVERFFDSLFDRFSEIENYNMGTLYIIFVWIFHYEQFDYSLWNLYDHFTGEGWKDSNTRKKIDEFEFDISRFIDIEKDCIEYLKE
jgi:hypothetical protein